MAGLIEELRQRNVIRVGLAYLVLSWLLLQVGDVIFEALRLPDWSNTLLLALLGLGLIPALVFSWAFELTPDGVKRESEIDRTQAAEGQIGKRLDVLIVLLLIGAIGITAFDRLYPEVPTAGPAPSSPAPRPGRSADRGPASDPLSIAAGDETLSAPTPESDGPPDRSVAVLPFVAMSADERTGYFADGLSEELLNALARIPDLQVTGRTSSFAFKGRDVDLREIGEVLNVANLLEGSVRQQGERVRVTAQLVRSGDGYHLWSDSYDRTLEDIFAIQDDIARSVAGALAIVLDESSSSLMAQVGTRDVDAFLAYRRGRELMSKAHSDGPLLELLADAEKHFSTAIEAQPEFAAPWFERSDYFAHLLLEADVTEEQRRHARDELMRSLTRAYELARLPAFKTSIDVDRTLFSDDWSALRSRVTRTLEADGCPNPTWIELAEILAIGEPLIDYWRRHLACDPLDPVAAAELGFSLGLNGDIDAGIAVLEQARQRLGDFTLGLTNHHNLLLWAGRFDEAMALTDQIPPDDAFYGINARVLPLAATGRVDEAASAFDQLMDEHGNPAWGHLMNLIALGRRDDAFALAAELDGRPGGSVLLTYTAMTCMCGEPWDLGVTPNFSERVDEAAIPWPPPQLIDFPAKDW